MKKSVGKRSCTQQIVGRQSHVFAPQHTTAAIKITVTFDVANTRKTNSCDLQTL